MHDIPLEGVPGCDLEAQGWLNLGIGGVFRGVPLDVLKQLGV